MPCVTVAAYGLLRARHSPLPAPRFPVPGALLLFLAFLVAALGEELGWSGYALDPMQERWSALHAGLVLGAIWALWHVIAMVEAGQSPAWIAWGCLDMLGTRVLMVWLYNNAGKSVFAVALYHAIANLSVKSMFPGGSYEAERIIALILAATAAVVTIIWGPRTLTRGSSCMARCRQRGPGHGPNARRPRTCTANVAYKSSPPRRGISVGALFQAPSGLASRGRRT